jgi:hypothetical protein
MHKRISGRLEALERADQERDWGACGWALSQLTPAELDLFTAFWHRDQAEGGAVAHEGAEAVARWQELYEYARVAGLSTRESYYAPIHGEAARRLRATGA